MHQLIRRGNPATMEETSNQDSELLINADEQGGGANYTMHEGDPRQTYPIADEQGGMWNEFQH